MAAARETYYEFANEEPTKLMDKIIEDTLWRFDESFESNANAQKDVLEFFRQLRITTIEYDRFKSAFLKG